MSSFESIRERSKNLLIYGGITAMTGAAMLGVGGSVFAQDASTPAAGTEETTEQTTTTAVDRDAERAAEYAAFLDALAANLGVADGQTVDAAIRTTLKQRIDEQLAAGEISADYAEEAKTAIDAANYPIGLRIGGMGGPGRGDGRDFGGEHRGPGRGGDADKVVPGSDGPAADDTLTPDSGTPTAGSEATA